MYVTYILKEKKAPKPLYSGFGAYWFIYVLYFTVVFTVLPSLVRMMLMPL